MKKPVGKKCKNIWGRGIAVLLSVAMCVGMLPETGIATQSDENQSPSIAITNEISVNTEDKLVGDSVQKDPEVANDKEVFVDTSSVSGNDEPLVGEDGESCSHTHWTQGICDDCGTDCYAVVEKEDGTAYGLLTETEASDYFTERVSPEQIDKVTLWKDMKITPSGGQWENYRSMELDLNGHGLSCTYQVDLYAPVSVLDSSEAQTGRWMIDYGYGEGSIILVLRYSNSYKQCGSLDWYGGTLKAEINLTDSDSTFSLYGGTVEYSSWRDQMFSVSAENASNVSLTGGRLKKTSSSGKYFSSEDQFNVLEGYCAYTVDGTQILPKDLNNHQEVIFGECSGHDSRSNYRYGKCIYCGYEHTNHDTDGERDTCSVCGFPEYIASYQVETGEELFFEFPEDLYEYLSFDGRTAGELTLMRDIDLSSCSLYLNEALTIDLNGYELSIDEIDANTLIIRDTSEAQTGKIIGTSAPYTSNFHYYNSTLTIGERLVMESGSIEMEAGVPILFDDNCNGEGDANVIIGDKAKVSTNKGTALRINAGSSGAVVYVYGMLRGQNCIEDWSYENYSECRAEDKKYDAGALNLNRKKRLVRTESDTQITRIHVDGATLEVTAYSRGDYDAYQKGAIFTHEGLISVVDTKFLLDFLNSDWINSLIISGDRPLMIQNVSAEVKSGSGYVTYGVLVRGGGKIDGLSLNCMVESSVPNAPDEPVFSNGVFPFEGELQIVDADIFASYCAVYAEIDSQQNEGNLLYYRGVPVNVHILGGKYKTLYDKNVIISNLGSAKIYLSGGEYETLSDDAGSLFVTEGDEGDDNINAGQIIVAPGYSCFGADGEKIICPEGNILDEEINREAYAAFYSDETVYLKVQELSHEHTYEAGFCSICGNEHNHTVNAAGKGCDVCGLTFMASVTDSDGNTEYLAKQQNFADYMMNAKDTKNYTLKFLKDCRILFDKSYMPKKLTVDLNGCMVTVMDAIELPDKGFLALKNSDSDTMGTFKLLKDIKMGAKSLLYQSSGVIVSGNIDTPLVTDEFRNGEYIIYGGTIKNVSPISIESKVTIETGCCIQLNGSEMVLLEDGSRAYGQSAWERIEKEEYTLKNVTELSVLKTECEHQYSEDEICILCGIKKVGCNHLVANNRCSICGKAVIAYSQSLLTEDITYFTEAEEIEAFYSGLTPTGLTKLILQENIELNHPFFAGVHTIIDLGGHSMTVHLNVLDEQMYLYDEYDEDEFYVGFWIEKYCHLTIGDSIGGGKVFCVANEDALNINIYEYYMRTSRWIKQYGFIGNGKSIPYDSDDSIVEFQDGVSIIAQQTDCLLASNTNRSSSKINIVLKGCNLSFDTEVWDKEPPYYPITSGEVQLADGYCGVVQDGVLFNSDFGGYSSPLRYQTYLYVTEHKNHTFVNQVCIYCKSRCDCDIQRIPAKDATCTEDGWEAYEACVKCGYSERFPKRIAAGGHTIQKKLGKKATCTVDGYTTSELCTTCGEILKEQVVVKAMGHKCSSNYLVPTCTEDGRTGYGICEKCGKNIGEESSEIIPALGHTEKITCKAVDATCEESGWTVEKSCVVCKEVTVHRVEIPSLGHSYETKGGSPATCTQAGSTAEEKCRRCGDVKTVSEVIPALGHNYVKTSGVAATCTQAGSTAQEKCSRCGDVKTAGSTIQARGHKYVEDTSRRVEPTTTAIGHVYYKCAYCGNTIHETLPKLPSGDSNGDGGGANPGGNDSGSGSGNQPGSGDNGTNPGGNNPGDAGNSNPGTGDTNPGNTPSNPDSGETTPGDADEPEVPEEEPLVIPEGSYAIIYDGNGATSGIMDPTVVKVSKSVKLKANTYKRTGYTFNGWNTKANGKGKTYKNKASVKKLAKSGQTITLYAQWTANKYTVKFAANGGKGKMTSKTYAYGKSYKLPKNGFTRKGYKFNGWNTKKNGKGTAIKDKASVKNLTAKNKGTVTLYAQWKKSKK